jgi:hypothetical protein
VKLDLTVEKINLILSALGNAPYVQVVDLIAEIQKQWQEQQSANQAASDAERGLYPSLRTMAINRNILSILAQGAGSANNLSLDITRCHAWCYLMLWL